jgi:hypothetical protein
MDAIYGVTLEMLAEIMDKESELKTTYGERDYPAHFQAHLGSLGLDWNTYAHAHNGWWERFRADPSGQLEARFHMKLQELSLKTHFGDVRDMSQDALEGVTLDTYARIMAGASAPNANFDAMLMQNGLTMAQFQRAQAAWNAAMGADTTFKLTTQYGQLYAKYTPGFQQQMMGQTAAILAAHNATSASSYVPDQEIEYTLEHALRELSSNVPATRWKAAHHCVNFYDIGNPQENPQLREALRAIPVLIECLERHDDHTVSDAESAARDLVTLGQFDDDVQGAMSRCLNRGCEKLATLHAAFAPIQHQAVPERVTLQAKIQDYTSLVESLTQNLEECRERAMSVNIDPTMPEVHTPEAVRIPEGSNGGGIMKKLSSFFR